MQKITGQDLKYTAIVGKPSEITFRFAEHVLAKVAQKMHLQSPRTLYMIGYWTMHLIFGLQCFGNVSWVTGMASGL